MIFRYFIQLNAIKSPDISGPQHYMWVIMILVFIWVILIFVLILVILILVFILVITIFVFIRAIMIFVCIITNAITINSVNSENQKE